MRTIVLCLLLALVGCSVASPSVPSGVSPPSAGVAPQVGVAYRLTLICPVPLRLGSAWWDFDDPNPWPPQLPGNVIYSNAWDVPGIVMLDTPDTARFRADVDGSQLALTRLETTPAAADLVCSGV